MKKILVTAVTVSVMLCSGVSDTQASSQIANPSIPQLELSHQVTSGMKGVSTRVVPKTQTTSSVRYTKKPVQNVNATTSTVKKTNTIQTTSKALSTTKKAVDKDLTVEGRIEKTQATSLYNGQTSAQLQEMVYDIGQNLIKTNGMNKKIIFKYVEKDIENANVNLSNTVTVYKGLIKACQTEDELAYVIGHEMGHANSSHVAKGIGVSVASSVANTAALYGISRVTSNRWAQLGVSAGTKVVTQAAESKISRVQEINADLLSIDYIVKAGYNPLASIAIMNKIGSTYLDVLSDHPSTDKRVTKMYNYIALKYPKYIEEGYDSLSYRHALVTIKEINAKNKKNVSTISKK